MKWIVLVFALLLTASALRNIAAASAGGMAKEITDVRKEIIYAFSLVIIGSFSFFFWSGGLMEKMGWFFILVWLFCFVKLALIFVKPGYHGESKLKSPATSISVAMINLSIAAGFWYVFYSLAS